MAKVSVVADDYSAAVEVFLKDRRGLSPFEGSISVFRLPQGEVRRRLR